MESLVLSIPLTAKFTSHVIQMNKRIGNLNDRWIG
jgi:hypothetical protein